MVSFLLACTSYSTAKSCSVSTLRPLAGRSRMCPIDESTMKSGPRNPPMVRALAGDSTMTRYLGIRRNIDPAPRSLVKRHPASNGVRHRSEEHTSELQSLMRISYAVFCLKKKTTNNTHMNEKTIILTTKHHSNKGE